MTLSAEIVEKVENNPELLTEDEAIDIWNELLADQTCKELLCSIHNQTVNIQKNQVILLIENEKLRKEGLKLLEENIRLQRDFEDFRAFNLEFNQCSPLTNYSSTRDVDK